MVQNQTGIERSGDQDNRLHPLKFAAKEKEKQAGRDDHVLPDPEPVSVDIDDGAGYRAEFILLMIQNDQRENYVQDIQAENNDQDEEQV